MERSRLIARLARIACPLLVAPAALWAQGSDVSISPFVSFLPPTGKSPLAGLTAVVAGSPDFGLRLNGRMALRNTYTGEFGAGSWTPPWGADIDGVTALSGHPFGAKNRSASSVAFMGIGLAAADTGTGAARVMRKNWSYGLGTVLPVGTAVDLFADSRWRMERFVLPTAKPHPARVKELRFGLTFHMGRADDGMSRRRRR
jgi:hypothetical protein